MIDKIEYPSLLTDMLDYSPRFFNPKAERVWCKCIYAFKFNLAKKIEDKYGKKKQSDLVIAFVMVLGTKIYKP
jgi:hypothetical protein